MVSVRLEDVADERVGDFGDGEVVEGGGRSGALYSLKANECIREAKHILGYTFSIHLDFSYLCANPLARIR